MKNLEIAQTFKEIAQILNIKGENHFRIRAYERAALNIESLSEDIEKYIRKGNLQELPGIGKDLAEKIKEIVKTGRLRFYAELKKSIPKGLLELLNIPGVGPRTAQLLYKKLKVKSVADLEKKARQGKLLGLFGIKEKTVENILKGIALLKKSNGRMLLSQAISISEEFISALKKMPEVKMITPAGSLRRLKETVRDIDILITSTNPKKIMDAFTGLNSVKEVIAKGATKSSVRTFNDVQVDLRVVEQKSFGAALLYFTGSKNFNIKLRKLAIKNKMKINEYGIFSIKGKKENWLAGKTEKDMLEKLKLPYIEPELREDRGEIKAGLKNKLPKLIEETDIKGDLHVHSEYSDGISTIEELVQAARRKGYQYLAIADHSQSLKVAGGLNIKDLKRKRREIERLNKKFKDIRILFGSEVDIASNGKLDYPDNILKDFDIVIAAIHTGFKQSKEQLTKRIISACENKYVNIIAHPTGRLWKTREPYEIDIEKILSACKDTNTSLEINAFPLRLDLTDLNSHLAKEHGVRIAISTDSHAVDHLDVMRFGITVARRGWLEKKNVINTLSLKELLKVTRK